MKIEHQNDILQNLHAFDEAVEVPLFYETGETMTACERHKGIFNVTRGELASVASDRYTIIQHRDVLEAVVDSLNNLNIEVGGMVRTYNHKFIADLVFQNQGEVVKDDAQGVQLGFRVTNSYDKSTSFRLEGFAYRLICQNGMVLGNTMGVREIQWHTGGEKAKDEIRKTVAKFVKEVLSSHERLQKYINDMIGDSVEWETMERIVPLIVNRKKHLEAVMRRLRESNAQTRWDLYNAITNYCTHDEQLKPTVQRWLEKVSQKVIVTPTEKWLEVATN